MNVFRATCDNMQTFYCPGCECNHFIDTRWIVTWSEGKPTVNPSILVKSVDIPKDPEMDADGNYVLGNDGRIKGAKDSVCHLYIREGNIQYLSDCTHKLANKTVPMKDLCDEE